MILPKLINNDILVNILPSAGGYLSRGEMACAKTNCCTLEKCAELFLKESFNDVCNMTFFFFFLLITALREEIGGKAIELETRKTKQKTPKLIQPLPKAFRVEKQNETSTQLNPSGTVCLSDRNHTEDSGVLLLPLRSLFLPPLCLVSICHGIWGIRQHMGRKL